MKKINTFFLATSVAFLGLVSCDGGGIIPDVGPKIGNTGTTADAYHYWTYIKSARIIGDDVFPSPNVTNGIFHTDGVKVTLDTFVRHYNIRTAYSILTTGNTHASQTQDRNFANSNWNRGKFYRLVLFTDALTEAQGLAINAFLVNSK